MVDDILTIQDVLHKKILRGWVKFPTGGNTLQKHKAKQMWSPRPIANAMADSVRSRNQQ